MLCDKLKDFVSRIFCLKGPMLFHPDIENADTDRVPLYIYLFFNCKKCLK